MKKSLLLLLFLPSLLMAQEFTIDTSRGEQTLVIPEEMTIEEAYKEMAQLYLEERWDHETTLENFEEVADLAEQYIQEVRNLNEEVDKLQEESTEYQEILNEERKPDFLRPYFSIGGGQSLISLYARSSFGVSLLEEWFLTTDISYPFRIGISVGRMF